jgi:UDP-hydrolysing UDP-N-acetyl-D-glucosamine 2-epimerase
MSNKKKVCVAITARPSYSRIRSALEALRERESVELSILCSGSALLERYGRVVDLIREDGFRVIDELYTFVEGDELLNMALTTSNTINHSSAILRREAPDIVVTVADRYETLGTAVSAAYLGIPLAHVQGGEITGNIDEKVRHAVTKLSDLHLVSTELAGERVRRMGEPPASVHVTGCPSVDLARESTSVPIDEVQTMLDTLGVGDHVDIGQDFVVVLQHPETDMHGAAFDQMMLILHVVKDIGLPIILFWPNIDAGSDGTSKAIRVFREQGHGEHMRFIKNLEGKQFLALLQRASCLIGNSSVGIRESAFLGIPVVNIGHRQTGRERCANVLDADWSDDSIRGAVQRQMAAGHYPTSTLYGDGYAGRRIADLLVEVDPDTRKVFNDG